MTRAPITHRIVEQLPAPPTGPKGDAKPSVDARIVVTPPTSLHESGAWMSPHHAAIM
jgi:hypothetical protein